MQEKHHTGYEKKQAQASESSDRDINKGAHTDPVIKKGMYDFLLKAFELLPYKTIILAGIVSGTAAGLIERASNRNTQSETEQPEVNIAELLEGRQAIIDELVSQTMRDEDVRDRYGTEAVDVVVAALETIDIADLYRLYAEKGGMSLEELVRRHQFTGMAIYSGTDFLGATESFDVTESYTFSDSKNADFLRGSQAFAYNGNIVLNLDSVVTAGGYPHNAMDAGRVQAWVHDVFSHEFAHLYSHGSLEYGANRVQSQAYEALTESIAQRISKDMWGDAYDAHYGENGNMVGGELIYQLMEELSEKMPWLVFTNGSWELFFNALPAEYRDVARDELFKNELIFDDQTVLTPTQEKAQELYDNLIVGHRLLMYVPGDTRDSLIAELNEMVLGRVFHYAEKNIAVTLFTTGGESPDDTCAWNGLMTRTDDDGNVHLFVMRKNTTDSDEVKPMNIEGSNILLYEIPSMNESELATYVQGIVDTK